MVMGGLSFDLMGKWKAFLGLSLAYPKFFKAKFSVYRFEKVLGMTNKVKTTEKDYFMVFGDYEHDTLKSLYKRLNKIIDDNNLGMVLIFESSRKKYHFIAPKLLDSFAEALHVSNEIGADKEWLNFQAIKGFMALRITRKYHKDEPKLIGIVFGSKWAEDMKISKDFINIMRLNYDIPPSNFDLFKQIDSEVEFTRYNTWNL